MKKNWRAYQTNDMVYPFCIVRPGKSFDVFEDLFDYFTAEVDIASGSFLTKKVERTFGEVDSQRRNPLKLSIKNYEYLLNSLYVKKYEYFWDRVVQITVCLSPCLRRSGVSSRLWCVYVSPCVR